MRRLLGLICFISIALMSYLYNERDENIYLYSELANVYVNLKEETFTISLYSNLDKSIYTNMNSIKIKYKNDKSNINLNIKEYEVNSEENYYRIDYKIYNFSQFEGYYKDFTLNISTSYDSFDVVLGNYYFTDEEGEEAEFEINYDSFNNINSIKLGDVGEIDNEHYYYANNKKCEYIYNEFTYLNLESNYHNKTLLIKHMGKYYLIKDEKLNKHFFKEIK